jgi:hypothetical protein
LLLNCIPQLQQESEEIAIVAPVDRERMTIESQERLEASQYQQKDGQDLPASNS